MIHTIEREKSTIATDTVYVEELKQVVQEVCPFQLTNRSEDDRLRGNTMRKRGIVSYINKALADGEK
jgi:hypothetical protein